MSFIKKIGDFYIFSNIHVALAGFFLTKITLLKFELANSLAPLFVGLSIIVSYNFIRFVEIKTNRLNWFKNWFIRNEKYVLVLSLISIFFIGSILLSKSFNLMSLIILFPFAFMTFFYVIPLFKIGKTEVSFRNFPIIKIFSIAIAWAGITVLFPLIEAGFNFTFNVYIEFVQRLFFLIAITIPFDIRDVQTDSKSLKTLPQVFSIKMSKVIGYVLLIGFVGLEFLKVDFIISDIYVLLLIAIITSLFLAFSSVTKSRYYTSFWVESVPIIWFGLIMLFLEY